MKTKSFTLYLFVLFGINPLYSQSNLLENVKNISTHDKKKTFSIIQDSLEQTGYCVFSEIMNTSDYTRIPQNRERTFITCFLEGKHAFLDPEKPMSNFYRSNFPPKKLNKTDNISDYLEGNTVDEKYYYRQDKYNYKELSKSIKIDIANC